VTTLLRGGIHVILRDRLAYAFDRSCSVALEVDPDAVVVFQTADARADSFADREPGSSFQLPPPVAGRGNPLTGPLAVRGAQPGDAMMVDILAIDCGSKGWAGAHAHVNPLPPGRVAVSFARSCAVTDTSIEYGAGIVLPVRPMVGCIGTAPAESSPSAGQPGPHGGNLDHQVIRVGTRVYLPVLVERGLLFLGDVHALQGDGELSSVALEIAAEVTVRVSIARGLALRWPWARTRDRLIVMTSAAELSEARTQAVDAVVSLMQRKLGMSAGDALALVSVAGDLRIGQAFGGMDITLRLEVPRLPGLTLEEPAKQP